MPDKLFNWLIKISNTDLDREGLVGGLAGGLVVGLVLGLVEGLVEGLVLGLAVGLIGGLAFGLAVGLVVGLAFGLGVLISINGIAFFQNMSISPLPLTILIIFIGELYFLLVDKKKPKQRENKFTFTLKRKTIALLISSGIIIELGGFIKLIKKAIPYLNKHFDVILKWLGYIGVGLVVLDIIIIVFYLYIIVNSLKYKKR